MRVPSTDWSRDQEVHHRVHDETARYRNGIAEDRAPLAEIRRSAAGVIADLIAAPGGPQVITVTAGAGDGKSALLGQVLEDLQARASATPGTGCPQVVLATRLDRLDGFRDARELGTAMRLPGPPAAVLSRVAAGRPALLVLDQVDAFGTGFGPQPGPPGGRHRDLAGSPRPRDQGDDRVSGIRPGGRRPACSPRREFWPGRVSRPTATTSPLARCPARTSTTRCGRRASTRPG